MADNVAITAGSGTTIAADDVGGALHQRTKVTWGPDGTGNDADTASGKPLPVQVRSSTGIALEGAAVSATFTPAASSHVANDVNGGAQTFSSVGTSGALVMIKSAELEIDGGSAEATAWRLYLYNVTPPSAIADDGAWDLGSGDRSAFLGYVDLGTAVDLGSTQWVETHGIDKVVKLAGTDLFGYLVNLTTLTPANVAHIVKLKVVAI